MLFEIFCSGPIGTNAYLLVCEKTRHAVVVDAPYDSFLPIEKRLKELSSELKLLLLTHSHWDHIAEAFLFKEKLGVPIWIHPKDAGNLENPGSDRLPLLKPIRGITPDHYIEDGEQISVGSMELFVIHTPGHTPGGACFYLPKEHMLLSGDTLFQGGMGNISLPTAEPKRMGESLKKLATLPPETTVFPGHGEPTTIGEENHD